MIHIQQKENIENQFYLHFALRELVFYHVLNTSLEAHVPASSDVITQDRISKRF